MKKLMQDLQHVGSFSTLTSEVTTMMNYGAPVYTPKQNELYSRLLIGLNTYDKKTLYAMNSTKKNRVKKAHRKAQDVLNLWKQELTIKATNGLFMSLFPEAKITEELVRQSDTSESFKNTLTFKDLGIRKEDIVEKFMQMGLLPSNFATL